MLHELRLVASKAYHHQEMEPENLRVFLLGQVTMSLHILVFGLGVTLLSLEYSRGQGSIIQENTTVDATVHYDNNLLDEVSLIHSHALGSPNPLITQTVLQ